MTDSDVNKDLKVALVKAAQGHHAATGGVNPNWADWYAEHLVEDVNRLLGTDKTVDELAGWLSSADERYRSEDPEASWPHAYADWLVEDAN
jgi:hypothetical protein